MFLFMKIIRLGNPQLRRIGGRRQQVVGAFQILQQAVLVVSRVESREQSRFRSYCCSYYRVRTIVCSGTGGNKNIPEIDGVFYGVGAVHV